MCKKLHNQNLKKIKCIQKVQREQTSRIVTNRITIFELINKLNVHWSIFIVNVHSRKFYEVYLIAYCTNIIICHKFKYHWNWFSLNPCIYSAKVDALTNIHNTTVHTLHSISAVLYFSSGIPITVYRSKHCDLCVAPSVFVYFHGGGNVVGCRQTVDTICRIFSR